MECDERASISNGRTIERKAVKVFGGGAARLGFGTGRLWRLVSLKKDRSGAVVRGRTVANGATTARRRLWKCLVRMLELELELDVVVERQKRGREERGRDKAERQRVRRGSGEAGKKERQRRLRRRS